VGKKIKIERVIEFQNKFDFDFLLT
jgi:hypothetical protein